MTHADQGLPSVSPNALTDNAVLLDVREDDEWAAGHAPDAVHIPLGDLHQRLTDLPADRPLDVVCRAGGRSARAVGFLIQQGYDARNVEGGMQAWAQLGRPLKHDGPGCPQIV